MTDAIDDAGRDHLEQDDHEEAAALGLRSTPAPVVPQRDALTDIVRKFMAATDPWSGCSLGASGLLLRDDARKLLKEIDQPAGDTPTAEATTDE